MWLFFALLTFQSTLYFAEGQNVDCANIRVFLYNSNTNTQCQLNPSDNGESLTSCGFDSNKKTYLLIDGYLQNGTDGLLTKSFLQSFAQANKLSESNIITSDYGYYATNKNLTVLISQTDAIANCFAVYYQYLDNYATPISNTQVVAFSNGVPVGVRILRITGLISDIFNAFESAFYYTYNPLEGRIASAIYQFICNKGGFGTTQYFGDIVYTVNNGIQQPQCICVAVLTNINSAGCSHAFCARLAPEYILGKTQAYPMPCIPDATSTASGTPRQCFELQVTGNTGVLTTPCTNSTM